MTSGLRALRDKTLAYFERDLRRNHPAGFATMLDAVSAYCHCLRAVAKEDREQLERSNLAYDPHTMNAGAQPEDADPGIFLVLPEDRKCVVLGKSVSVRVALVGVGMS